MTNNRIRMMKNTNGCMYTAVTTGNNQVPTTCTMVTIAGGYETPREKQQMSIESAVRAASAGICVAVCLTFSQPRYPNDRASGLTAGRRKPAWNRPYGGGGGREQGK